MSDKVYYVNMHTLAWCSTQSLLAEPQRFRAERTEKKGFHSLCTVCLYILCVCVCVCVCVLFEKSQQTHGPAH